ncbi:uncharacterized protein LOC118765549 [Octopus sinensis]|uniref:Uncharacterized protein LOC118765549 n=1 Tax=Octopus sinensis TaxID=2607531 RepID=A0A7E6F9M6_9MOLL|nr:uncharacterized protein LOC118765549 [Octopus sinensis]
MCERNCSRTPPGCLFRVDRFGIGLKYQCHCFDIADCDFDNDGHCKGARCIFGYSGPTCQRRLFYVSFATAVRTYMVMNLRHRRATCLPLPQKIHFLHVFRINWVKFNISPAVKKTVYITSMGNQPLNCTFNRNSPNRSDASSHTTVSCTGDISTDWLHINGSNTCIENLQMSGCPQELFGLDCTHKCRCKNGTTCHQITGHCKEGCEPGRTGSSCQYQTYENIALGRPAFQSSDFEVKFMDGRKLCNSKYLATAGFAVDGKYNQNFQHKSCSRTQESSSKSYWYVILDRNYTINQIRIYAHSFFHYGLNVFVGDKNDPCSQLCYESKSTETILHISCQRPLVGETVCIQTAKEYASLSLCEVEVIRK